MLDEVNNVRDDNFKYPNTKSKTAEILEKINNRKNYNRNELADHLEKMGLGKLADDLLHGRLR